MATAAWDVVSVSTAAVAWDVLAATAVGVPYVDPTWDILSLSVVGVLDASVVSDVSGVAEPGTVVTLVASSSLGLPGAWSWRVISGAGVTLSPLGASASWVVPYLTSVGEVSIGVTGLVGGSSTVEAVSTVTVPPHQIWTATAGAWAPYTARVISGGIE